MKSVLLLISVFAFEQLSSNLKNLIVNDLEPFSERKMLSLSPKMQKNRIYEIVKVPRGLYPFEVFRNVAGGYCAADENGRLDENINLHQVKENGKNFAHVAPVYGHTEIVQFLAEQKVDLERADIWGRTPVSVAAAYGGHTNAETLQFLAEQKVDLEGADIWGRTPVFVAAAYGHTETVKFLAEQKVDLKRADNGGRTPFSVAAEHGRTEIVKLLANQKVNLERADNAGRTPVFLAAVYGHTEIVKFLAEQKVDLERADIWGRTPAQIASKEEITTLISDALMQKNLKRKRSKDYNYQR